MSGFFEQLLGNLVDTAWWASELPSWIFFGVVASWGLDRISRRREAEKERRDREPYERWKLRTIGYGEGEQDLYYEEVRKFLNSDFELWKMVKSVVSGACEVNLTAADKARNIWLLVDPNRRMITVDFNSIPDAHVTKWKVDMPNRKRSASEPPSSL